MGFQFTFTFLISSFYHLSFDQYDNIVKYVINSISEFDVYGVQLFLQRQKSLFLFIQQITTLQFCKLHRQFTIQQYNFFIQGYFDAYICALLFPKHYLADAVKVFNSGNKKILLNLFYSVSFYILLFYILLNPTNPPKKCYKAVNATKKSVFLLKVILPL